MEPTKKHAKVTISLPEELLAAIDAEAEALGESRSGFIQEATARYVVQRHDAASRRKHHDSVARALDSMRAIAATPTLDPRPTLEILREMRAKDGTPYPLPEPPDEGADDRG